MHLGQVKERSPVCVLIHLGLVSIWLSNRSESSSKYVSSSRLFRSSLNLHESFLDTFSSTIRQSSSSSVSDSKNTSKISFSLKLLNIIFDYKAFSFTCFL